MRISAAFAAVVAGVLVAVAGCSNGNSGQSAFPVGKGGNTPGSPSGNDPTTTPTTGGKRALNPESVVPCSVIGKTTFVDFQITQNEDVDSFRELYGKEGTLTQKSLAGYDTWVYQSTRFSHCDVLISAGPYNMGYVKYERNSGETEPDDAKLCDDVQLIATALLETIG